MSFRAPRTLLAACTLVLALVHVAGAQEYSIIESLFLPPEYYVGDPVELRLTLRSRYADSITLPRELPQPSWGTIQDIRMLQKGSDREIRVRFVPFEPGTKTLPPLNLGPLVIADVNVFVSSILTGEDQELRPLRGQLLLPGTQVFLVLLIGGIVLLPVAWFFLFRSLRGSFQRVLRLYQDGKPYRKMQRNIRVMRSAADTVQGRDFYISLLREVREYLSMRFHISAFSLTTKELEEVFAQTLTEAEDRKGLSKLFLHGDMVKFANLPSTITTRMSHLDQVERIVGNIESRERRKRRELEEKKRRENHVEL